MERRLIPAGRVFKNQKADLSADGVKSENEISKKYVNDDGPGVLIGFGVKPSGSFLLSFETACFIPWSRKEWGFDDNTMEVESSYINIEYGILSRMGLNYKYSKFVTLGLGGGYIRLDVNITDSDRIKGGSFIYSIYQFDTGVDIKPSDEYTLLFGLNLKRIAIDQKINDSAISFNIVSTKDYLGVTAGVSKNY